MNASASAIVIEDVDLAEPSNKFNSAAVEPTTVPPNFNPTVPLCPAISTLRSEDSLTEGVVP